MEAERKHQDLRHRDDVESGRTFEHQIDTILHYVDHRDLEDVDLIASMVMQDLDEFLLAR